MICASAFSVAVKVNIKDSLSLLVCFSLQLVMAKFRKYEKQALDLHTKKKEEREENEKKRKDRLAQKKMEEEALSAKAEASITELTDDEAVQLQKEIDKVCVISLILALM
jgi:organic hydroperoxide reductase OsmC/OhrA